MATSGDRTRTTAETGRTVRRARRQSARPTTRLPDGQVFPRAALLARRSPCLCPFCLLRDRHRQGEQIDEALGVLRVVAGHGEAREALAIQRIRRGALRDGDVALVELEANCARDALLRGGEVRIERLALRREPHAVID